MRVEDVIVALTQAKLDKFLYLRILEYIEKP
jgi:hypothetical protein